MTVFPEDENWDEYSEWIREEALRSADEINPRKRLEQGENVEEEIKEDLENLEKTGVSNIMSSARYADVYSDLALGAAAEFHELFAGHLRSKRCAYGVKWEKVIEQVVGPLIEDKL